MFSCEQQWQGLTQAQRVDARYNLLEEIISECEELVLFRCKTSQVSIMHTLPNLLGWFLLSWKLLTCFLISQGSME